MNLTDEFADDYRRLATDVTGSNSRTLLDNLLRWFDLLDSDPVSEPLIKALEDNASFESWYQEQMLTMKGMAGSARIIWPKEKRNRLGLQISLFRAFAEGNLEISNFSSYFIGANDYNLIANEIVVQYFRPFSDDLIRYLIRTFPESPFRSAPASDRTVTFDNNAVEYRDVIHSVEELKNAIEGANDFPEVEARSERLGEINAGLELLKAAKARVKAMAAVLGSALVWLLKKFSGEAIGKLASFAIDKLTALLGTDWLDWL